MDEYKLCDDKTSKFIAGEKYKDMTILNRTQNCVSQCTKLYMSYSEHQYLQQDYSVQNEYRIIFPETVKYTVSTYSYTFTNLIAEAGGWTGLLIGLSVLDIFDYFAVKTGLSERFT